MAQQQNAAKKKSFRCNGYDKLTFMPHLGNVMQKANQMLHVLSRIKRDIIFEQNKLM